jgi:hypothetical protein
VSPIMIWSNEITDDTGFLGIIDPAGYQGLVAKNRTYERLLDHFKTQMQANHLLIWETGLEGNWRVRVDTASAKISDGFRSISGPIFASGAELLLVNYETLTMAAQFEDKSLPEQEMTYCKFAVEPGLYECRITQMFDPANFCDSDGEFDFILQLASTAHPPAPWTEIPWAR